MRAIEKYYASYKNSFKGFEKFHNEVINMPRDQFSDTGLEKIRVIAGYLLLCENEVKSNMINYRQIMQCIHDQIVLENFPNFRDIRLEKRYFEFSDINVQYKNEGRMFRHLMGLAMFFGLLNNHSRSRKTINYDKCKEYYYSNDDILIPIARNNLIMMNVSTNDYIKTMKNIKIDSETDYCPAYSILQYMQYVNRPATKFELSFLLGRIDDLKIQKDIIRRAIEIGKELPATSSEQQHYLFSNMGWKDVNGKFYAYAPSQEPDFKFNNFLLFLEKFGLIINQHETETYILTNYAFDIINDDISYLIADLEHLLDIVDNSSSDKELNDLILYQRNPQLLKLAKENTDFIKMMNFRSLNNPKYDQNGKKKRNRLIAELAKIIVDYKCQYALRHIFKMENGKYYCESHHIIEFSTENGPDITNNLVVLGPEAHMILHHACKEEVDNVYLQLTKNGSLLFKQFEEMATIYQCLTNQHINILFNKKIITQNEKRELEKLIA